MCEASARVVRMLRTTRVEVPQPTCLQCGCGAIAWLWKAPEE